MGSTREIISFQFGDYANYVGTHFWNLQTFSFNYDPKKINILNHDILFREGRTLENEVTFTPRCIISDFNDENHQNGSLSDPLVNIPENTTNNTTLEQIPIITNQIKINNSVKWLDNLKTDLHPKSIQILNSHQFNNTEHFFDNNTQGAKSYMEAKEDYEDKIHFFSEDCDYLQGFNIICDTYNAFGGVLNGLFDDIISDDFSKKTALIYSVQPPLYNMDKIDMQLICLNSIISYVKLSNHLAFVVPISTSRSFFEKDFYQQSGLSYEVNSQFESSAILASAIHNNMLPLTLINKPILLYDMLYPLAPTQNKILSLSMCFPFFNKDDNLIESLEKCEIKSLSSRLVKNHWTYPQHVCVSGGKLSLPETSINVIEQKTKFMDPFPKIFTDMSYDYNWSKECELVTSLQSISSVGNHLEEILKGYEMFGRRNEHKVLSQLQLEYDELHSYIHQFKQIISQYDSNDNSEL